jgi:hypothetical protein
MESTLTLLPSCPKDGVHLWVQDQRGGLATAVEAAEATGISTVENEIGGGCRRHGDAEGGGNVVVDRGVMTVGDGSYGVDRWRLRQGRSSTEQGREKEHVQACAEPNGMDPSQGTVIRRCVLWISWRQRPITPFRLDLLPAP